MMIKRFLCWKYTWFLFDVQGHSFPAWRVPGMLVQNGQKMNTFYNPLCVVEKRYGSNSPWWPAWLAICWFSKHGGTASKNRKVFWAGCGSLAFSSANSLRWALTLKWFNLTLVANGYLLKWWTTQARTWFFLAKILDMKKQTKRPPATLNCNRLLLATLYIRPKDPSARFPETLARSQSPWSLNALDIVLFQGAANGLLQPKRPTKTLQPHLYNVPNTTLTQSPE